MRFTTPLGQVLGNLCGLAGFVANQYLGAQISSGWKSRGCVDGSWQRTGDHGLPLADLSRLRL